MMCGEDPVRRERFIGLDIETTGSDVHKHGLIQIGVFVPDGDFRGDSFVSDVKPWPGVEIDAEASKIHGITFERMMAAPESFEVDEQLAHWLEEHGIDHSNGHVVGFNVGSFDMVFVRKYLPKTAARLSYRTVDLNAILFTIAEWHPSEPFRELKRRAKRWAEAEVTTHFCRSPQWHDAGYDALASYECWRYLVDYLNNAVEQAQ